MREESEGTEIDAMLDAALRSRRPLARMLDQAHGTLEAEVLADALFLAGVAPEARGAALAKGPSARLRSALARATSLKERLLDVEGAACPHCGSRTQRRAALLACPRCQPLVAHPREDGAEADGGDAARAAASPHAGTLRVGCALWNHAPWTGELYPRGLAPRERLRAFSERFDCVEGNSFFYADPGPETLARWRDETRAGFRFYPKFPRHISHEGSLPARIDAARRFFASLDALCEKIAMVFLQLPPQLGEKRVDEIPRFFRGICADAAERGLALGCELRDDALIEGPAADALDTELRALRISRVLLDTRAIYGPGPNAQEGATRPKPKLVCVPRRTTDAAVLRLVAHPELERNEAVLGEWSARLCDWLADGTDVTVFAHCPDETCSPRFARTLYRRMRARMPEISPLPWEQIADAPRQRDLF